MSETSSNGNDGPGIGANPSLDESEIDQGPIDAEFKEAEPDTSAGNGAASGPGWAGAMALAALAAIGGSIGGTAGGRLLGSGSDAAMTDPAGGEAIRGALAEVQTDLAAANATLDTRIDTNAMRARENAETLVTVRETVAGLADDIVKVDRIATFDRRLSALETASDDSGEDASATEIALGALGTRIDALEVTAASLTRATDALAAFTDGVDFSSIEETLQSLDAELAALSEQTQGLAAAAAEAAQAAPPASSPAVDPALALALADISRAAATGAPFVQPHSVLAASLPGDPDIELLAALAPDGVATLDQISRDFANIRAAALAADPVEPEGGIGLAERIFGDQIKVRRDGVVSTEDQLALAETALMDADLAGAMNAIEGLPAPVLDVLAPWQADLENKSALDAALDRLRVTIASYPSPAATDTEARP